MNLTEKLAALPPEPKVPDANTMSPDYQRQWKEYFLRRSEALEAYNALLCEALREQMEITTCGECDCAYCAELRSVLAACEVKP